MMSELRRFSITTLTVMTALLAVAAPPAARGQEDAGRDATTLPSGVDAVVAVSAAVEIERTLLEEDTRRYRQLAARRSRSVERLAELYRSLDLAVERDDPAASALVTALMDQIEQGERDRAAMIAGERSLVDRISERLRKIGLLEERIASLEARVEDSSGALTGQWDVTLLPTDISGVFTISQSGTLLSGTYRLEGGWTGSLQGTLVNRKVYLVRIDSKLGRSMELEGYLSSDGSRVRGTWLDYELAGQQGSTGQWSAVRRASR